MAGAKIQRNGHPKSPSEESPLLPRIPAPPTAADASREADVDFEQNGTSNGMLNGHANGKTKQSDKGDGHTQANQTISLSRAALCTLALGMLIFLQATNISMLTTTQSAIANDLDAFERTTWFTSAYLIAVSSLGPLNGKLATVFSPRVCIFASTVVLAAGVMVSSAANSFEIFILGRALTGMGASGILTISIIIVLELTGSKRRGLAIGMLNAGFTFGVAAGATAAGALLPSVGWRALFWMQAPIALFGGTILLLAIPATFTTGLSKQKDSTNHQSSTLRRLAQLDYLGALTLTSSIVLILYALSSPRKIPLLPILLSAVVFTTFILNEVYLSHDPIIPIALLKSRGLLLTCLGTVGFMMARWAVLFYTPTYALAVRQWSPSTAGSLLIPTNGGFAIGSLMVGWLHIRRQGSFYLATVVVYALFPVTLGILAFISTDHSSPVIYVLVVFVCGAVTGSALNYTLAHILHLTPKSTHYIATSLLATFRGFAGSFGSAVGGGLFTRTLYTSLTEGFEKEGLQHREELVRRLLGSPALVENLDGVEREVAINGYQDAIKTLFLAMAGLAVLMVFVQAGTGWNASTEARKEEEDGQEERRRLVDGEDSNHDGIERGEG